MKLYFWLTVLLSMVSLSSFAMDEYKDIANQAKNHAPEQMRVYKQDAENAKLAEKKLMQTYQNEGRIAETQAKEMMLKSGQLPTSADASNKRMPSILIFVSFSMPTQSLEAYLRDAKKIHASVVIRGLIDNSFQKTFQRIATLVKASGGNGVELNPLWFKRFDIQTVPAVVVVPGGSACLIQLQDSDHA
jgi:conjugal transfer pilus assembly protein TrbC